MSNPPLIRIKAFITCPPGINIRIKGGGIDLEIWNFMGIEIVKKGTISPGLFVGFFSLKEFSNEGKCTAKNLLKSQSLLC